MASKTTLKALGIISGHTVQVPSQFARLMWPDSESWGVSYKCGPYGACFGIALNRSAGAYLGRLKKAGLVYFSPSLNHWKLTEQGQAALKEREHGE